MRPLLIAILTVGSLTLAAFVPAAQAQDEGWTPLESVPSGLFPRAPGIVPVGPGPEDVLFTYYQTFPTTTSLGLMFVPYGESGFGTAQSYTAAPEIFCVPPSEGGRWYGTVEKDVVGTQDDIYIAWVDDECNLLAEKVARIETDIDGDNSALDGGIGSLQFVEGPNSLWAVWFVALQGNADVMACQKLEDGWTTPVVIGTGSRPTAVVDDQDRVHVIFTGLPGFPDPDVPSFFYTVNADGSSWSEPVSVLPETFIHPPTCCGEPVPQANIILAGGTLHVLLGSESPGLPFRAYYTSRSADGTPAAWTSPQPLMTQFPPSSEVSSFMSETRWRRSSTGEFWATWVLGAVWNTVPSQIWVGMSPDGTDWTNWQVDNGNLSINQQPGIYSGPGGEPWVVFSGQGNPYAFTRYIGEAVPVRGATVRATGLERSAELAWSVPEDIYSAYRIRRGTTDVGAIDELVATLPADGTGKYTWTDTDVAAGTWRYEIAALDRAGGIELLGSVDVQVGAAPAQLTARVLGSPGPGSHTIRLGAPQAGSVTIRQLDVAGRQVGAPSTITVAQGWSDITWDARTTTGSAPAAGIYWLDIRGAGTRAAVRLLELPR